MSDKSTVYHPTFPDVTREVATEAEREAHKAAGWRMTPIGDDGPTIPAGNASRDEWEAYALTLGADAESLTELTRDQLRESFGH